MIALSDARRVIAAAEAKAREIGQPMNIAVVDTGGNLVSHVRMDGAWIGSIDISINKPFTARAFDTQTAQAAKNSQPGQQFFGIHASNNGRVMIFAGGETVATKIFGRLSAWQNWIFTRPNATGDEGALKRYGTGAKARFDWERV